MNPPIEEFLEERTYIFDVTYFIELIHEKVAQFKSAI